jgi:hypothetical protein
MTQLLHVLRPIVFSAHGFNPDYRCNLTLRWLQVSAKLPRPKVGGQAAVGRLV